MINLSYTVSINRMLSIYLLVYVIIYLYLSIHPSIYAHIGDATRAAILQVQKAFQLEDQ